MTAGVQKIMHRDPRIGFLAQAEALNEKLPALEQALTAARAAGEAGAIEQAERALHTNRVLHFNNRLDALVAATFLVLVSAIVVLSVREWLLLLGRRKAAVLYETEPVWLPDYAVKESGSLRIAGAAALAFALAKELSGEAEMERVARDACRCECRQDDTRGHQADLQRARARKTDVQVYLQVAEKRFKGVKRCC